MSVITPPQRETRAERPCLFITSAVTMSEIGSKVPGTEDELFGWLKAKGIQPAGPSFWRYREIDMAATLIIDVGVPVAEPVAGDGRVQAGTLPGGDYIITRHHGHPDGLLQATGELLDWAKANGVQWDSQPHGSGERWASRLEWYLNSQTADLPDFDTELAFLAR